MTTIKTFVDSIAVKMLHKNAILAGVGNELHLYTNAGSRVLEKPLRLRGKVHGIEMTCSNINAWILLIYGEREFMLLTCTNAFDFKLLYDGRLSDWISGGKLLEDGQEFVLLTAHSVLLRFSYVEDTASPMCHLIARAVCTDKSTLYCAYLHGSRWKQLSVFGGNAFGELLIWWPAVAADLNEYVPLQQRVSTHNGVLFSIDYNANAKLLTTTSDDRSIKFWHVTQVEEEDHKLVLIASGFGHVARVFQGKIITHGNEVYAISAGEDSHFCIWRRNGELVFKRRQQFGATIWNFEYNAETKTLFTVGSSGNLLAYGIGDVLENKLSFVRALLPVQSEEGEYVSKIRFLTSNLLISVTNKHRLLFKNLPVKRRDKDEMWKSIAAAAGLGAYKCTVLEVHDNLISLCGYRRFTLLQYDCTNNDFSLLYDGQLLGGVIRACQFLNAGHLLVSDDLGYCALLRVEQVQLRCSIELPKCKEPWLTSALLLPPPQEFLLVCNRQGNLLLYVWQERTAAFELQYTLQRLHGKLGATTLVLVDQSDETAFIKSAGHDGSVKLLCLHKIEATLQIYTHEHVPVSWVEQLIPADPWLLLGFNDNHLVVWSRKYDFVRQVPCGGGHRCWHYTIYKDTGHTRWLQLAFIQHKRVQLHRMKLFNEAKTHIQLPAPNEWHVRPCNVMSILENGAGDTILVSAGDDNLIKVFTYKAALGCGNLLQQAEVHAHISNVRALKVVRLNADCCLLFSGGGRAQLCVSKLQLRTFQVQQVLNYTLQMSKTQEPTEEVYRSDPETRIMTIDVQPLQQHDPKEFHIYIGCSDGFVRKLHLNMHMQLNALAKLWYGKCVLQVRLIGDSYVLTAATDGVLCLYDANLQSAPLLQLRHHASGVNALDALLLPQHDKTTLHLLTGGDDQALSYTQLLLTPPELPRVIHTLHLPHQHTAQVTAVRIFSGADDLLAFSSGVDQKLYRLNLHTQQMEREFHSCVADIKGVCVDRQQTCFLYGCGLQIHNFDS